VLAGIDHVQLAAPPGCEAEARRFFGEVLGPRGAREAGAAPGRAAASGSAWARSSSTSVSSPTSGPARKAHPAFSVTNYDELVARLDAAGAHVEPDESIPGLRRCFVLDPGENRLELVAVENSA
jgi:catechol 2,3-dioxygenase-like lactoylglutathione lyase family enzyme